jgi:hypothetical protein
MNETFFSYLLLMSYKLMKAVLFRLASLDASEKHGGPPTYGKQWNIVKLEDIPFYAIPLFALLVSTH